MSESKTDHGVQTITTTAPTKPSPRVTDFHREMATIPAGPGKVRHVPGRLSRKGMEQVINSGQSVILGDMVISRIQDLPSEADVAVDSGDQSEVDRVRASNEAEIKRLRDENERLKAAATAKNPQSPAPPAK